MEQQVGYESRSRKRIVNKQSTQPSTKKKEIKNKNITKPHQEENKSKHTIEWRGSRSEEVYMY
jgi:hypothetical protein